MPRKIDEIVIEDYSIFDNPAKILLRDDGVIELYAITEDSLEHSAGRLDRHTAGDLAKIRRLMVGIKQIVKEKPFSRRSQRWLTALDRCGLLPIWEDML